MGKYHDILGIEQGASKDKINAAFKKLAKKYHPDANPGDAEAEAKFKEISAARDGLLQGKVSDEDINDAARKYARGGSGPFNPFAFDPNEIFRRMHESFVHTTHTNAGATGTETICAIPIPYENFLNGGEVEIQYNVPIFSNRGFNYQARSKKITIPKECRVGQRIVLPEEGAQGVDGVRGKLVIELYPQIPPPYEINDIDIILTVRVDVLDVLTGKEIGVKHPDGPEIKIELSPNQRQVMIEGAGLEHVSGMIGNFMIIFQIGLPKLNTEQTDILKSAVEKIREVK